MYVLSALAAASANDSTDNPELRRIVDPRRERARLAMPTVELSAGPIDYRDSGGTQPTLVLLHGVLMDGGQWRDVEKILAPEFRCILPTLPLGAHRRPMHPDADLSLLGQARLVAEFLDVLDLGEVTLAFNDWAAPQLLIAEGLTERVSGLVLVACETAGNYPPGLPGRNLALLGAIPGGLRLALSSLKLKPIRRTPMTFGWMAKRGIPDDLIAGWLDGPWADPAIRADARKYVRQTRDGRRRLQAASEQLDRPGDGRMGGGGSGDADERGGGSGRRFPQLTAGARRGQLHIGAARSAGANGRAASGARRLATVRSY
jgi:pimeloyl-ACP methyl ester carboxylesterase